MMRDKKLIRNSLLWATGSLALDGLGTRDKWEALNAGMSGFDGMVRGLGGK